MPMKNSRLPDAFLAQWVANNPIRIAEKTGSIVTCPVRLAFVNLEAPAKPMDTDTADKTPTYNAQLLFPPGSEAGLQQVMVAKWMAAMAKDFPNHQPQELHNPFRDQGTKQRFGGFTPGLPFITASTTMKPQIVDPNGNPVFGTTRIYAGVWAIVSLNLYSFGLKPVRPKKGVSFGLLSVMIVGDDEPLGASAPPAADDFAGVRVDQQFDPSGQFGNAPAAAPYAVQGASIMPAAAPAYAAPPAAAPAVWSPLGAPAAAPAALGWAPPGAAPAAPPPAPGYLPSGVSNEQTLYGAAPPAARPLTMEDMM